MDILLNLIINQYVVKGYDIQYEFDQHSHIHFVIKKRKIGS
jgi:hypothetical protein